MASQIVPDVALSQKPLHPLSAQKQMGWLVIGAAWASAAIITGMASVYFGLESGLLELPNHRVDRITNQLNKGLNYTGLFGALGLMLWLTMAYKRLPTITGHPTHSKSWWAWAGVLIPFANFVMPFRIGRELGRDSNPLREACGAGIVNVAQASAIIAGVLAVLSAVAVSVQSTHEWLLDAINLLAPLMYVVAAAAWTSIVRKITIAQSEAEVLSKI